MVRLAAKRNKGENYHYFVGNLSSIPVLSGSVDTCIHLFAPFHDTEFGRVSFSDGLVVCLPCEQVHGGLPSHTRGEAGEEAGKEVKRGEGGER